MEHGRAQRMRITVSMESVRVSVPKGVSFEKARAFVLAHAHWIRLHLARMKGREEACGRLLENLPPVTDPDGAREKIIFRCRGLSLETGLSFTRLTIRNQKTRWGSCSSSNAISLNIKLARLPDGLMDYVILHELVHTKIKGHGRNFWDELDRYVGDSRRLRRELGKYLLSRM